MNIYIEIKLKSILSNSKIDLMNIVILFVLSGFKSKPRLMFMDHKLWINNNWKKRSDNSQPPLHLFLDMVIVSQNYSQI